MSHKIFSNKNRTPKYPYIMGILNITPDSFFNSTTQLQDAFNQIEKLKNEKADIIDIGAESTRPGAKPLSSNEEKKRLEPLLKKLTVNFPNLFFSLDTYKPEIAEMGFFYGISMINDITGLQNKDMRTIIKKHKGSACIMHMQKIPETMQDNPTYSNVTKEVFDFLKTQIMIAKNEGISKLVIDPGIGFGKTVQHNLELIKNINQFKKLKTPVLLGVSRKSFISHTYKNSTETAQDRLSGTIAACLYAYLKKVDILRVHDVQEIRKALITLKEIKNA